MGDFIKNKRLWWIAGAVVLVILAAVVIVPRIGNQDQPAADAADSAIATAFIGDLSASATASGTVVPGRVTSLSTQAPGRVIEVLVRAGDSVTAGDPLVVLDTADLELNLRAAQQNLRLQEATLAGLQAPPTAAELAAAEAQVASARAQLDSLLSGPTAQELAAAEADLLAAQAAVWSSSAQLSQAQNAVGDQEVAAAEAALAAAEANLKSVEIQYTRNPDPDNIQANTALAQARQQVASAQARLDTLRAGPDANALGSAQANVANSSANRDAVQAQLDQLTAAPGQPEQAAAEAALAQAQAALATLQDGPTPEELAAAEASVAQARINLEDAQSALDDATLRAPFDGVVTAVNFSEGELASGVIVRLVDPASLEVVLQVDEIDVADIAVGQPAAVSLETWPDVDIESSVLRIAPAPVAQGPGGSAIISYEVHLSLGETDLPVRSGMTASANLVTAEKRDVLLVPNTAINADRNAGTYSVNLVTADGVQQVDVTVGLRDDDYTEITSGLQAGDQVQINTNAPVLRFGPPDENEQADENTA